jgi:putative flippase GtrA
VKRIFWFLLSGGCGFVIDAGLTHVLIVDLGASAFAARIPAIMAAMAFTFFINRSFTFGRSHRSVVQEGFRYWAVGVTSAVLNYAIYSLLMHSAPILQPIVAVTLSSMAATGYSFFGYSRFVFRHQRNTEPVG